MKTLSFRTLLASIFIFFILLPLQTYSNQVIFEDDFNDGVVDPVWQQVGGSWSESGGLMTGHWPLSAAQTDQGNLLLGPSVSLSGEYHAEFTYWPQSLGNPKFVAYNGVGNVLHFVFLGNGEGFKISRRVNGGDYTNVVTDTIADFIPISCDPCVGGLHYKNSLFTMYILDDNLERHDLASIGDNLWNDTHRLGLSVYGTTSYDSFSLYSGSATPPTHATFWGTIRNDKGNKVCGLVLANGQQMFTCNPLGEYSLTVPLDNNLEVKLMSFADGHMPFKQVLPYNQVYNKKYDISMKVAEDCSAGGICGSALDFNGGNMPMDWSVVRVSKGALANDRLEAYTTDGSIVIGTNLQIPAGTSELVIKYTAFHPYTNWSTSNQLHFKNKDDVVFQKYLTWSGAARLGENKLAARINNLQYPTWQNPAAQATPVSFVYGIYNMEWRISESGAWIEVTSQNDGQVVMSEYLPIGISFDEVSSIEIVQATTTDNDAWLDDLLFSCH